MPAAISAPATAEIQMMVFAAIEVKRDEPACHKAKFGRK